MASSFKVLGQVAPSADTDTDLYTVPSATQTVISTIVVANRSGAEVNYTIAIRPAGVTLSDEHYVAFDVPVGFNDSTTITSGFTLDATDVITVSANTADLSFSVFGSEVS